MFPLDYYSYHRIQVHDGVEKNLTREVEKIKNCQDKMRRMIEEASIQLK